MTQRLNIISKTIVLSISLVFMLSSCETDHKKKNNLEFKTYHHTEKIHLFDNENYPSFNMDLSFTTTTDSLEYPELYHSLSTTYYDSLRVFNNPVHRNLQDLSSLLIKEYRLLEKDLVVDSADIGSSFNWEIIKNNKIICHNAHYISFVNEIYMYTGGAHGNKLENYYTFSLKSNQLIDAKSFFKSNSCEAIIQLQKVALKEKVKDLSEFFLDGLSCTSNFYITKKGVTFHYNQYDIASYAAGSIDILIKTEDIIPFITDPLILE